MSVTLRPQRVSDAKRFFEILGNHKFPYFTTIVNSLDDEIAFLKKNAQKRKTNFEYNYTILVDKKFVGGCGIKINQHRPHIGEIGYVIDEAYWGQGIATKAVKLLEKIGFKELNLSRIEIVMDKRHKASEKVAIKAGYQKEGVMRKAFKDKNKRVDVFLYAKVK